MSADDIADLAVTEVAVCTWFAEKTMPPTHKVGRLWKFQANEIDDWGTPRQRGWRGRQVIVPVSAAPAGTRPAREPVTQRGLSGHLFVNGESRMLRRWGKG